MLMELVLLARMAFGCTVCAVEQAAARQGWGQLRGPQPGRQPGLVQGSTYESPDDGRISAKPCKPYRAGLLGSNLKHRVSSAHREAGAPMHTRVQAAELQYGAAMRDAIWMRLKACHVDTWTTSTQLRQALASGRASIMSPIPTSIHLVKAHEDGPLDVLVLPHRLNHEVRLRQALLGAITLAVRRDRQQRRRPVTHSQFDSAKRGDIQS